MILILRMAILSYEFAHSNSSDSIDCVCLINEETFLSGSDDGSIALWSINKKKPIYTQKKAHKSANAALGWTTSVAALANTDLVASGSDDGCIIVWIYNEDRNCLDELFKIKIVSITYLVIQFYNNLSV
jgi:ribosomal RNA-processing protein 9